MSEEDRRRWNQRYSTGDYSPRAQPSSFLERAIDLVRPGPALDLACGTGRNALRLAEAGFDVEAIDVSEVAIERARQEAERRGLHVTWRVADLDEMDFPASSYHLIVTFRYVNRRLWQSMVRALEPDGWLLQEQHLRTRRPVRGPGEEFRVGPGELLDAFEGLRVVEYRESLEPEPERGELPAATARLLACKGDPGW